MPDKIKAPAIVLGGLLALCTSYVAHAQEVVKIGTKVEKFEADEDTAAACEPWGDEAVHQCGCCITHKYLSGVAADGIENACKADHLCPQEIPGELGAAEGRPERVALASLVAKRMGYGNDLGVDRTFDADIAAEHLTDEDRGRIMDLLDSSHDEHLVLPATPPGARDPFRTGHLNRRCVQIANGRPGEFTVALYFVKFNDACDQDGGQGAWNGGGNYTMRYVVKVLANPMGELYNLALLDTLLQQNGYWAAQQNADNHLPAIIVPTASLSYVAAGTRRYMTIMPVAPGKPLSDFATKLGESDNGPTTARGDNAIGRMYRAWSAVGDALGRFHLRFMAARDPGAATAVLRPTVIHGDFHQDNVFYDPATDAVTFIDAESMAGSLEAYLDNNDVGVGAAWLDFIRPFAFSCCLDNLAFIGHNPPPLFPGAVTGRFDKGQLADVTIRPFLKAYVRALIATSLAIRWDHPDLARLKGELLAAFDRNATVLSWATFRSGVPGAKPALYSPWRYHAWKKGAIRPNLTGATAGADATHGSL